MKISSPSKQQAHGVFKGFAFQAWLTVDAWLELRNEDRLYIELAEDFAKVLASGEVEVAQVKAKSAPISLRSPDVVEAIEHLWDFQRQGDADRIRYSLLTTAAIAMEQGDHFGGETGIEAWQIAASNADEKRAEAIRLFLIQDGKIRPDIIAFLKESSAGNVLQRLIVPLVLETGREDFQAVRATVETRIAEIAIRDYGLGYSHAKGASVTLFEEVFSRASAGEKTPLSRLGLRKTVDRYFEAIRGSVLAAKQEGLFGSLFSGASNLSADFMPLANVAPIVPGRDFSVRERLVAGWAGKTKTANFIVISGSSGMGKTTLAQLYSKVIGGAWVQLRAIDENRALRCILECMMLIDGRSKKIGLIVDDLPWEKLGGGDLNLLRGLAMLVRRTGSKVIFTNQRIPSDRELASVDMEDAVVLAAPGLDEDEVREVAMKRRCPSEKLARSWCAIVRAITSGHPILVHSEMIALEKRKWPNPTGVEFAETARELADERSRKQRLLSNLHDEDINFLRRLSVYFGTFTRAQALRLAQKLAPIGRAGIAFENLEGPWLERVSKNYFQVAPLIGKTLLESLSRDQTKELNAAAAQSILAEKQIPADDLCYALVNAVLGEAEREAMAIISKVTMAPTDKWPMLRPLLAWTLAIDDKLIFPSSENTAFAFRLVQLEVASDFDQKRFVEVLNRCDDMIAKNPNADQAKAWRSIIASILTKVDNGTVPIQRLLECADALGPEIDAMKSLKPAKGLRALPGAKTPRQQMEAVVVIRILGRQIDVNRAVELIDALEEGPEIRKRLLELIAPMKTSALLAFDRLWLSEEKKANPSWPTLISFYEKVIRLGASWGSELLVASAARALMVIHSEYLNDSESAIAISDQVQLRDLQLQSVLFEQRGNVELAEKRYLIAKKYFEAASKDNIWVGLSNEGDVACIQKAGACAGFLKDWRSAADCFEYAGKLMLARKRYLRAVGFEADEGFALWMLGERPAAVKKLSSALLVAEMLPPPEKDLATFRVLKCIGHVIHELWSNNAGKKRTDEIEVAPGLCSELGANEAIKEFATPSLHLLWALLVWLEFDFIPTRPGWKSMRKQLLRAGHPTIRYLACELACRIAFKEGDYRGILINSISIARALAVQKANRESDLETGPSGRELKPGEPISLESNFPISMHLICGLAACVCRNESIAKAIAEWSKVRVSEKFDAELRYVLEQFALIWEKQGLLLLNGIKAEQDTGLRWVYSLRALAEETIEAEAVFAATVVLANCGTGALGYPLVADMFASLDFLISKRWLLACEQRFAFRSPNVFIPEIKQLAETPDGSIAHIAKLGLAAYPALALRLPQAMVEAMQKHLSRS